MTRCIAAAPSRAVRLIVALFVGVCTVSALLLALGGSPTVVSADPIPPEKGGYPKFNTSTKMVTPTLVGSGGATLTYTIELRNTGAYTATDTTLTDVIPEGTAYNDDAWSSVAPEPTFDNGALTWNGDIGFDSSVLITFSVSVLPEFTGTVRNAAMIDCPDATRPVTKTAQTVVTDEPILTIEKTSAPDKPGAEKPMTYTLTVSNRGQPAHNLPITVTDHVPENTSAMAVGIDGEYDGDVVTWHRLVTLDPGDTTAFTFSVGVDNVLSGTVITNDEYSVDSPETPIQHGASYTATIVDPIFRLSKHVWPDPPGSNREMTYTLEVLNKGSLATDLVITDRVPSGVRYEQGGTFDETDSVVSWTLPKLDTGESADFTYTAYVGDVMDVAIVNDHYGVCSSEGVCQPGETLTSVVKGPTFEATAMVEPVAHKPGGGTGTEVYPVLTVRNLGPGNALDAQATLRFDRISVQLSDLYRDPPIGTLRSGPDCGEKCKAYVWMGHLDHGDTITFATHEGQNTIGGLEGTPYTATVVVTDTDDLGTHATEPVTATAVGHVTHFANLRVQKTAPPVIGRGQLLTYTIDIWNTGLSTEEPPYPTLWDVLPISGAVVLEDRISHGGRIETVTLTATEGVSQEADVISWTLPAVSTGERIEPRSFAVQVDGDLVSGTKLVNDLYLTRWYESEKITETYSGDSGITLTGWFSNTGTPVTTTVKEVGLIDSYKEVTPTLVSPGPGNVLTYFLHIVNSGPISLTGVSAYDFLPWESSTYQRDAEASAGEVISDIVSIKWVGDVDAFSEEVVTFTTVVDEDTRGPVTNTAVISHPDLLNPVEVDAVAYVTEKPVLEITKQASKNTVQTGDTLKYTIRVVNRGQRATDLVITDTLPANTEYVPGSGGSLKDDRVEWTTAALEPGESREFLFSVTVTERGTGEVINDRYGVMCDEGVSARGKPVVTEVKAERHWIYLPLVLRHAG